MNTANLQLEGLIMAIAAFSDAVVKKGILTHDELGAALVAAELAVGRSDNAELSKSSHSAVVFPIRILSLANQASLQGRSYTFADYAQLVGKLG